MEANAGEYLKNNLHLKSIPRISLHCKLVPVQYWEYEYGLFQAIKRYGQLFNHYIYLTIYIRNFLPVSNTV